jgi:hypothetical protein
MAVAVVMNSSLSTSTAAPCRAALDVACIGCLVPPAFSGTVTATFRRAIHLQCGETIVSLVTDQGGEGPATLLLCANPHDDLRAIANRGDPVSLRRGTLQIAAAMFDAARARTWRPSQPRSALPWPMRQRRMEAARQRLAAARRDRPSVLTSVAAALTVRMATACRDGDAAEAVAVATMLVGLGEGLTPAGDDFLVGLMAALRARIDDRRRRALVDWLGAPLAASRARTTPLAAQSLAFAARGHFDALVLRALDALLAEPDDGAFVQTLAAVLATGATSGADLLTGMLIGLGAWHDAKVCA